MDDIPLKHARGIGTFFGIVGRLMMAAGLAWAGRVLYFQKKANAP